MSEPQFERLPLELEYDQTKLYLAEAESEIIEYQDQLVMIDFNRVKAVYA